MNIEDQVREAIVAELKRQSEAGEQGLDNERAKRICEDVLLYAHGLAAMQATGRTNFAKDQVAQRIHEMHDTQLAKNK